MSAFGGECSKNTN